MTLYTLLTVVPLILLIKSKNWLVYWVALAASYACLTIASILSLSGKCEVTGCGDGIANFFEVVWVGIWTAVLILILAIIKSYYLRSGATRSSTDSE